MDRTLDAWRSERLEALIPTGKRRVSNGPTEVVNALIKKVKKVGHGVRNLDSYRLRLLLAAGVDWRTVTWLAFASHPDQRPLTTLGGVEPGWYGVGRSHGNPEARKTTAPVQPDRGRRRARGYGIRSRGSLVASRSSRLSQSVVPPASSAERTAAGEAVGFAAMWSAAAPATCGEAIDVPLTVL